MKHFDDILFIITCVVFFELGGAITYGIMQNSWEKDCIKHNAAEYRINPTTGKVTWDWKQ
jgi:hypothetical protein